MRNKLIRFGLLALMISALAGCGGGSDGAAGTAGAPGAPGKVLTNVANLSAAEFKALVPTIDPASVSVTIGTGKPVVKFTVTDQDGNAVAGLGGQTLTAANAAAGLPHTNYLFSFTLAKLVQPAVGPSKWVNYLITTPKATGTAGAVVNGGVTWGATFPSADNQGTLVDNGDGSYQYTFFRDITQSANIVAGLTGQYDTAPSLKADLGDVTFDPTLTHRLGVIIHGSQPGTGSATPDGVTVVPSVPLVKDFNMGYDFVPNGGTPTVTRDIVIKDSCTECHSGKGIGHWSTTSSPGDTIGRNNPRLCVTCHTDQIKYTFNSGEATSVAGSNGYVLNGTTRPTTSIMNGRAIGNYPNLIHKMHMGEELVKTGYFFNAASEGLFNEKKLPQSPANCTKCHDNSATAAHPTTDGDNWKNKPSRLACGACHDGIDFATGLGATLADRDADVAAAVAVGTTQSGHMGGLQADDSGCGSGSCHSAAAIALVHQTNTATPHNPVAGEWKNHTTHTVSTITYKIVSASVNASRQPVIKFQITKDGTLVTALATPALVTNAQTGAQVVDPNFEPIPGFASGPSLYMAYSVPQDGIAAPADFNAYQSASLTNLLVAAGTSPNAGTLTSDGAGTWTATLTGDLVGQPVTATCLQNTGSSAITGNCVNPSPIVIPASAKMATAAMIGTFTQKGVADYAYVAANVAVNPNTSASGGVIIKSVLAKAVATGFTARRVITDAKLCNSCHDQLGTSPEFHGGARNDPTACNICHNGNRTSNGWSADSSTYIHGIHAGGEAGVAKRTVGFTWAGVSATDNYSTLQYPGQLKNCNQCHLPDTVNFAATGGTGVQANLLWSTTSTGTAAASFKNSPYITVGTNYGNGYTFTPAGAVVASYKTAAGVTVAQHVAAAGGEIVPADTATLVNSPIASACFACHDTSLAKSHMTQNGGVIYSPRGAASLTNNETCLVCHAKGKVADVAAVHNSK